LSCEGSAGFHVLYFHLNYSDAEKEKPAGFSSDLGMLETSKEHNNPCISKLITLPSMFVDPTRR